MAGEPREGVFGRRRSGSRACPISPSSRATDEVDGLRLAYLDEGEGPPVVFFHGEPTWSFLWRQVIPPVRDAGFRCIAPDYAGFGRSDKPTDLGWYTYDRHVELIAALLEELDLRDATAVVHDWGGPIGLRIAVEHADRISRLVIMDTGPFTGHQQMSDAWLAFRDFVRREEDVPVGFLVRGGCKNDPGDEVIAAYEAPYIGGRDEGRGARLPADPADQPRDAGRRRGQSASPTRCATTSARRSSSGPTPTRCCRSRSASGSPSQLGMPPPRPVADAGHFLQEDAGPAIGATIAEWLRS